jgi:hypothetical protein
MAEYTPPTENVPIFDVSNFVTSTTGLTETQIASKFLRFPTGQGTETLPALITGSITAPNTMNIVMPNSASTNVLNVGVVTRNIAGQIHHYSDGDNCVTGAGVHLNNGTYNNSATNIHNGTGSNPSGTVNIMSGVDNTGTITMGRYNGAGPTQTTTTIAGDVNIAQGGGSVNMGNTSGSITLGGTTNINTTTSATITVGNSNSITNMYGLTTIGNSTISPSPVNTTRIRSNVIAIGSYDAPTDNTKTISIGARTAGGNYTTTTILGDTNISNTGGAVNIGLGGTITMSGVTTMNTGTNGSITIGANAGAVTNTTNLDSATINIGKATSTVNMIGSLSADKIDGSAVNSAMTYGGNLTSGSITIGNALSNLGSIFLGGAGNLSNTSIYGFLNTRYLRSFSPTTELKICDDQTTTGTLAIGTTGVTTTTVKGTTTNLNATATNINGTTTILGTTLINTTNTLATTIGNTTGTLLMYGSKIKQIIPLLGGNTCEVSYGNADNATSLSTIFNRKSVSTSPANINLYQLVIPTNGQYSSQYFEIVIAGSNQNFGAYSYKGCFSINNVTATSVNTIFSTGGIPTFTFSNVGVTITMAISVVFGASTNQNFISTLIAYPTINIDNLLSDYSVTAV